MDAIDRRAFMKPQLSRDCFFNLRCPGPPLRLGRKGAAPVCGLAEQTTCSIS